MADCSDQFIRCNLISRPYICLESLYHINVMKSNSVIAGFFYHLELPECFCVSSFQADLQSTLGDTGYIVFGVILFVWELLPTSLVMFFFRVRQPNLDRVSLE